MEPLMIKKGNPEEQIQNRIIEFLRAREWLVMVTHGNLYQKGFPDLFATHRSFRQRWIEIKNLDQFSFTAAQLEFFPLLCANGSGVWIMCDATEAEYQKLFKPCNWWEYNLMCNKRGFH